jgi:hypothetical protein
MRTPVVYGARSGCHRDCHAMALPTQHSIADVNLHALRHAVVEASHDNNPEPVTYFQQLLAVSSGTDPQNEQPTEPK